MRTPRERSGALLTATGFVCFALVAAVLELLTRRRRAAAHRRPDEAEVRQIDVHRV